MARNKKIQTTIVVQGDSKHAVRQLNLTQNELEKLTGAQRRANKAGATYSSNVGNITRHLARYALIAGGVAATATAALVKQQFSHIDTLAKTADKLGVTTEALSGLRLAAELTGVQQRQLDLGIQRMTRRMAEVATGTGEAKEAVRELGLDAKELSKLPTDQILIKIAEAMEGVTNQSQRVRLAFKFFDSEGVALVNTLGLGADALREIMKEADELGLSISRVDAAKIEAANDAATRARAAFAGLTQQIAIGMAPAIESMNNDFTDWVKVTNTGEGAAHKLAAAMEITKDVTIALGLVMAARLVPSLSKTSVEFAQLTALSIRYRDASLLAAASTKTLDKALMLVGGPQGAIFLAIASLGLWILKMEDAGEKADNLAEKARSMSREFKVLSEQELRAQRTLLNIAIQAREKEIQHLERKKGLIGRNVNPRGKQTQPENFSERQIQAAAEYTIQIGESRRELGELQSQLGDVDAALAATAETMEDLGGDTHTTTKRVAELLKQLRHETSMIGYSNRERAIAIALHRANGEASAEEAAEIKKLAGSIFDAAEAQRQLSKDAKKAGQATATAAAEADPFARAWEAATERIDAAFADAWKGAFDSFDDFSARLKDAFHNLLAELVHVATTKKILINLGLAGGGTAGGAGGAVGTAANVGSIAGLVNSAKTGYGWLTGAGGVTAGGAAAGYTGIAGAYSGLYTSLYDGASALGIDSLANAAGNRALDISTLSGAQVWKDIGVNMAAGLAGGLAGNVVGGALFDREQATGGLLSAAGGFVGSAFLPGLGTAAGAFIGSVLDTALGGSSFSGKRVKYGVTAGGRQEGGYDYSRTGASGLELGLITRRTDNVGLTDADESKFLDAFLKIDETLTTLARAGGVNIDLAGATLKNQTARQYDGQTAPSDFFGSLGKGGLSDAELKAAPEEFVRAWFDAVSAGLPDAIAKKVKELDGNAEELVAGFGDIFAYEATKKAIGGLFAGLEDEADKLTNATKATQDAFENLTGQTLPHTRAGLREYIAGLDVQDEANRKLLEGIVNLTPALNDYLKLSEDIGKAMAEQNKQARELAARNLAELNTMLSNTRDELARITRSEFQNTMADIVRRMEDAEKAARDLGASEVQLADIRDLAAVQTRQAIKGLRANILNLADSLYGANLQERIEKEQQHVNNLQTKQRELYDAELRRYQAAIDSNKTIKDFLDGLKLGDLSTLSPQQQVAAAQRQFQEAIRGGSATEAAGAAQTYLEAAREFYASSGDYKQIFIDVNKALNKLLTVPGAAPTEGTVNTASLRSLQRRADTEARERATAERAVQFADFIQALRDYSSVSGQNISQLLELFDVNSRLFAGDYKRVVQGQPFGLTNVEKILAEVNEHLLRQGREATGETQINLLKSSDTQLQGINSGIDRMNRELIKFREESWRMHHLNNENRTWNRRYVTGALNSIDRNLDNGVGIYLARAS